MAEIAGDYACPKHCQGAWPIEGDRCDKPVTHTAEVSGYTVVRAPAPDRVSVWSMCDEHAAAATDASDPEAHIVPGKPTGGACTCRDRHTGLLTSLAFYDALRYRVFVTPDPPPHSFIYICVDNDQFRAFNDQFGRRLGDRALKDIANVVAHTVGSKALSCMSDNDFEIVLHGSTAEGSEIAEEIRGRVEDLRWPESGNRSVTISGGVAPVDVGFSMEKMYDEAMDALHHANRLAGTVFEFTVGRGSSGIRAHVGV